MLRNPRLSDRRRLLRLNSGEKRMGTALKVGWDSLRVRFFKGAGRVPMEVWCGPLRIGGRVIWG